MGVVLASTNGGATFARTDIPLASSTQQRYASAYVSAVDPNNPNRLYVRIDDTLVDQLLVSDDGAMTFATAYQAIGPLLGFALSADGFEGFHRRSLRWRAPRQGDRRLRHEPLVFPAIDDSRFLPGLCGRHPLRLHPRARHYRPSARGCVDRRRPHVQNQILLRLLQRSAGLPGIQHCRAMQPEPLGRSWHDRPMPGGRPRTRRELERSRRCKRRRDLAGRSSRRWREALVSERGVQLRSRASRQRDRRLLGLRSFRRDCLVAASLRLKRVRLLRRPPRFRRDQFGIRPLPTSCHECFPYFQQNASSIVASWFVGIIPFGPYNLGSASAVHGKTACWRTMP